jgi:hypothetical protein
LLFITIRIGFSYKTLHFVGWVCLSASEIAGKRLWASSFSKFSGGGARPRLF